MKQTVIIGAGSWGTALAALWAKDGRPISLWGNNAERISRVQSSRENTEYLPGVQLAENIRVMHELTDCREAELIVFVTPSLALATTQKLRLSPEQWPNYCVSAQKWVETHSPSTD